MITGELLGIIAGILSFSAYFLYIVSTVLGKTKPNRATWWILTLIGLMIASSYYASGARATIWVAVSYTVGPFLIALLSLKYGEGRKWKKIDKWCFTVAIISMPIWYVFNSAVTALVINIFLDFIALLPTMKKSYLRPHGEDRMAWTLELCSNVLNIFAIEKWVFAIVIYPVYLFTINGFITLLLYRPLIKKMVR